MKCLNSESNPASVGTLCYDAPSRYQIRIAVTPNYTSPTNQCVDNGWTPIIVPNTSSVYVYSINNTLGGPTNLLYNTGAGGYVGTADQTSVILNTPQYAQLTSGHILQSLSIPTSGVAGQIASYVYTWQNYSHVSATGNITISLPYVNGVCPSLINALPSGYNLNTSTCQVI